MAEYTEADLARELEEEMKREEPVQAAAAQVTTVDGETLTLPAGPRKRGPPRRKGGSSSLPVVPDGSATTTE